MLKRRKDHQRKMIRERTKELGRKGKEMNEAKVVAVASMRNNEEMDYMLKI